MGKSGHLDRGCASIGQSENRRILKMTVMDPDQFLQRRSSDVFSSALLEVNQNQLYAFLGAYEECANQAIEMGDQLAKQMPGASFWLFDLFLKRISAFSMACQPGQSKYRKLAMKSHKTLKDWLAKSNPNAAHKYSFLEAELAVPQGKKHSAKSHYEAATGLATRGDFIYQASLIHRRYG
jgi:hypothetical protein